MLTFVSISILSKNASFSVFGTETSSLLLVFFFNPHWCLGSSHITGIKSLIQTSSASKLVIRDQEDAAALLKDEPVK